MEIIKVRGGQKSYLQLVKELSEISKAVGCSFNFVSGNPGLYTDPEIIVPEKYAEEFRRKLAVGGLLYDAAEAACQAIEQIRMRRNDQRFGGKIELGKV